MRRFGKGVTVSLWTDVSNTSIGNLPKDCVACIEWADGSQTGTCPPHRYRVGPYTLNTPV
jgi:hypothetical protein